MRAFEDALSSFPPLRVSVTQFRKRRLHVTGDDPLIASN
jgi:hypothetical protein